MSQMFMGAVFLESTRLVREWVQRTQAHNGGIDQTFPPAFLINPLCTWWAKGRVNAFSKPSFKSLFNRGQRMERPVSPWIWGRRGLGACGGEPAERLLWIQSRDQRHFTQKWGTMAKILLENPLG